MSQEQRKPMRYNKTIDVRPANFVEPARYEERRELPAYAPRHEVVHTIDAPLSATQHIELRTSAVDRAKGFLIASTPLYAAFALGVLLVSVLFFNVPFWSFWGLSVFWLSFVLAWLWGYRETLVRSAEGIAHYEAKRKWDVIEEEQRRRWEHYDRQIGDGE
jgi:hypothetical protein